MLGQLFQDYYTESEISGRWPMTPDTRHPDDTRIRGFHYIKCNLVVRGSWFVVRGRRFLCTYSTVARFLSEIVPTDSSSPPLLLQF